MSGRLLRALLAIGIAVAVGAPAWPASGDIAVDGRASDWATADLIGTSLNAPSDASASIDLTALHAADNATSWFFRLSFDWVHPGVNASLALYLFPPADGDVDATDPSGAVVSFPNGSGLAYAIYLEVTPAFPTGSRVTFFDGITWKNRTFAELGVAAALNVSGGFLELSLARASFASLRAGRAAAVELLPAAGGGPGPKELVDSIPDAPAPVGGRLSALVPFFDYALEPPVEFSALGLSDPFAADGDRVVVFVELTNLGPKNISSLSAQVLVDGAVVGSQSGLQLLPLGTAVLDFEWTVTGGSHNVTAISFPGGASRTLTMQARPPGAQLTIVSAVPSTSTPVAGAQFSIEVEVHNGGAGASGSVRVLLKDGTQVIGSQTVSSISANGTTKVSVSARATKAGLLPLRVEIDGITSPNSTTVVPLTVSAGDTPFGLLGPLVLVVGVAACAVGAWALAPRLQRRRERPPPESGTPPPL